MREPLGAPVHADVDLHAPADRRELRERRWPILAAISLGGAFGALARHGLQEAFHHPPGAFGWAVFGINVSGCFLIGVLMVLVNELWAGRRLVRPFLGVGVLGGFTTFSAYAVDIQQSIAAGVPRTGLAYLAATMIGALIAVWLGDALARWVIRTRPRAGTARGSRRSRSAAETR